MPESGDTLLIEGTFSELAQELATYFDTLNNKSGGETQLCESIKPLLDHEQQDETLKILVAASTCLNSTTEREFQSAYHLLLRLVQQSENTSIFLYRICQNLRDLGAQSQPNTNLTTSIASILTTVFNIIPMNDPARYYVFADLLRHSQAIALFEVFKPQLQQLHAWFDEWKTTGEDRRKLLQLVAQIAGQSRETRIQYQALLAALRTYAGEESESDEARDLAIQTLRMTFLLPHHYDFQDLIALDCVQALRRSEPIYFQLLEVFNSETIEELESLESEQPSWLASHNLSKEVLLRKLRLLTLASLASAAQTRSIPYSSIARELRISEDEVELWVIDVIRAGLVEGKLSQLNQNFLVHRSTNRVFGEKQWSEVQGRLDIWRSSLEGILTVVRQERERLLREKEREYKEIDARTSQANGQLRWPGKIEVEVE